MDAYWHLVLDFSLECLAMAVLSGIAGIHSGKSELINAGFMVCVLGELRLFCDTAVFYAHGFLKAVSGLDRI